MASLHDIASRFNQDPEFRRLAQRDPRAALQSAGIAVPGGVSVDFLDDAFVAVGRLLDDELGRREGVLEDALLDAVAGGTGAAVLAPDLERFLGLLRGSHTS